MIAIVRFARHGRLGEDDVDSAGQRVRIPMRRSSVTQLGALVMVLGVLNSAWVHTAQRSLFSIDGDRVMIWFGATETDWARLDQYPEVKTIALPHPPNIAPPWTITASEFAHVAKSINLEQLFIGHSTARLPDDALQSLTGLRKLRSVELFGPIVSDAGITHLAGLTTLERLRFDGNTLIGDAAVAALRKLTNLRELYFHMANITDAGLANVGGLTKLETLTLGHSQVGDRGMETIARFKELRTLDLQHTRVTDAGMEQLKGLTKLRWIALHGTRVTGRGFAHLSAMSDMTYIEGDDTQLDDTGLVSLRTLSKLEQLYISNTRVTEAGLREALPNFPELAWLRVNNLPLTDAIVPILLGLRKPARIEMNGTGITAAGEARLRAAGHTRVNVRSN